MINQKFLLKILIFWCLCFMNAYAIELISSKKIKGLSKTIDVIMTQTESKHPIPFPTLVPESDGPLYAVRTNEKPNMSDYWIIMISEDAKCVTKTCVIGSLSSSSKNKLDLSYMKAPFDQNKNPILKEKVILAPGFVAYYTPGHAEADWHQPSLEWQQDGRLYQLSWDLEDDAKDTLIDMMKSTTS